MSVNSVSSVSVSTVKPQKNETVEKIKNAVDFNKDGDVKLEGSIIGLGIAGLAALGLAIKGRHQKVAQTVAQEGVKVAGAVAQEGEKVVVTVVQEGAKVVQAVETQAQKAKMQVESAIDAYKKSEPYKKVKNTATRNLPKNLKTQNKAQVYDELLQKRKAEQATKKLSQEVTKTVNTATKNQNIASNNITSKTREGIREQIKINYDAANEARQAANAAKQIANENPTKTYARKARYTENKAVAAENKADQKYRKLRVQRRELIKQENIKTENKMQFEAHQTPEAKAKLEANQQKTQLNAAIRKDKELLQKPGTQKAMQDIKRQHWYDDKILDAALNESGKYSKYEQRAAQAIVNGEIKL